MASATDHIHLCKGCHNQRRGVKADGGVKGIKMPSGPGRSYNSRHTAKSDCDCGLRHRQYMAYVTELEARRRRDVRAAIMSESITTMAITTPTSTSSPTLEFSDSDDDDWLTKPEPKHTPLRVQYWPTTTPTSTSTPNLEDKPEDLASQEAKPDQGLQAVHMDATPTSIPTSTSTYPTGYKPGPPLAPKWSFPAGALPDDYDYQVDPGPIKRQAMYLYEYAVNYATRFLPLPCQGEPDWEESWWLFSRIDSCRKCMELRIAPADLPGCAIKMFNRFQERWEISARDYALRFNANSTSIPTTIPS